MSRCKVHVGCRCSDECLPVKQAAIRGAAENRRLLIVQLSLRNLELHQSRVELRESGVYPDESFITMFGKSYAKLLDTNRLYGLLCAYDGGEP
jgi:hypothetical protein